MRAAGLECIKRLAPLMDLGRVCGWWWPFAGAIILTEKPCKLSRDARNRLHCEAGAAIEYPDGWGVYAWHGLRVPADIILAPEKITTARIEDERNTELRRVMVERYGAARYIEDSGAKEAHRDDYGVLYRKPQPDDEELVMVKVRNSTPEPDGSVKDYWLRVPPEMRTARQAVAWTFGFEASDYAPAVQT
jgi:hypothetical protein